MRTTSAVPRNRSKKRLFQKVKGYVGGRRRLLRTAKEALVRAGVYATRAEARDSVRTAMAQMNPNSSRPTAVTIWFLFLPRAASLL